MGEAAALLLGNDGDDSDGEEKEEEEEEVVVLLLLLAMEEAMEPPVPRRTSCRSPATGEANRDGDCGPAMNSGDAGVETEDEEVVEEVGVVAHGSVEDGSWYSLRTTTRVMCRALRESRLDAYSRAWVRWGGRFCESRMDVPASRGEDMRCFRSDDDIFFLLPARTELSF